jgi:hypothetical protein
MRTTKCRIRPHGISVRDNKLSYEEGHVQIWKELSDAEFIVGEHQTQTDKF